MRVADPGFSRVRTPEEGAKLLCDKFYPKLHENEEILAKVGGGASFAPP